MHCTWRRRSAIARWIVPTTRQARESGDLASSISCLAIKKLGLLHTGKSGPAVKDYFWNPISRIVITNNARAV